MSDEPRPMASAMFDAPWFRGGRQGRRVMPRAVWCSLTPRARHLCRNMVPADGEPDVETGFVASQGDPKPHRVPAQRVHAIRQLFGGSQTGGSYLVPAFKPRGADDTGGVAWPPPPSEAERQRVLEPKL